MLRPCRLEILSALPIRVSLLADPGYPGQPVGGVAAHRRHVGVRAPGDAVLRAHRSVVEHLEVADPADPMVMVLNTQRLTNLLRGEPLEAAAA